MFLHVITASDKEISPIYWCGKKYLQLTDIAKEIHTEEADKEKILQMIKSRFLSWKFKEVPELINNLIEIEEITEFNSELGYYYFMYLFNVDKAENTQSLDDLFLKMTEHTEKWHENAINFINNDRLQAYFLYKGHKNALIEFKKNLTGELLSTNKVCDLYFLYLLFDRVCEDKIYIRKHYLELGPHAQIYESYLNHIHFFPTSEVDPSEENIQNLFEILSNLPNKILKKVGEDYRKQYTIFAQYQSCIAIGETHIAALRKDGTVVTAGENNYGQCNTKGWRNIIAVIAGDYFTVGLTKKREIISVGDIEYHYPGALTLKIAKILMMEEFCQSFISECFIIDNKIKKGVLNIINEVIRKTIKKTGLQNISDQIVRTELSEWNDIVDIYSYKDKYVCLKKEGTVVTIDDEKSNYPIIDDWRDITAIAVGEFIIAGLKKDGTVVCKGKGETLCNTEKWDNIVEISAGSNHIVGLKKDGSVLSTGDQYHGRCNTSSWKNIIAVSACKETTIGLTKYGTILTAGKLSSNQLSSKLLNNIGPISEEQIIKLAEEEEKLLRENQIALRNKLKQQKDNLISQGLCDECGGNLVGYFNKKCEQCGKTNFSLK
ncbi:MAG: RCC1 domain-containing protein [Candidatus Cloacimonetes bacterium]|nr:RCC1 domain-containing protein [Candidatus Cloacimonadota bacterium]